MALVLDLHVETFTRDGVDILRDIRWEVARGLLLKDGRAVAAGPLKQVLSEQLLTELYDYPCEVTSSNARHQLHRKGGLL